MSDTPLADAQYTRELVGGLRRLADWLEQRPGAATLLRHSGLDGIAAPTDHVESPDAYLRAIATSSEFCGGYVTLMEDGKYTGRLVQFGPQVGVYLYRTKDTT